MELNFEGLEIKKWNIPTDRAQRVDEKYGVISPTYHVYSRKSWSLKCQKWIMFCILCSWQQKNSHSVGKIFKCTWKILLSSFWKCGMVRLLSYRSWDNVGRNIKNYWVFKKTPTSCISRVYILLIVAQNIVIHSIF